MTNSRKTFLCPITSVVFSPRNFRSCGISPIEANGKIWLPSPISVTEAIRQLTGQAADHAVPGAKLGLVSGYGMVAYDRCLCTGAVILGAAS